MHKPIINGKPLPNPLIKASFHKFTTRIPRIGFYGARVIFLNRWRIGVDFCKAAPIISTHLG